MAKLKSGILKQLIVDTLGARMRSQGCDPYWIASCTNISKWKRFWKDRVRQMDLVGIPQDEEDWDEVDTLDTQDITDDCVVRQFAHPDESYDCIVISDPKDERVLKMLWHCD